MIDDFVWGAEKDPFGYESKYKKTYLKPDIPILRSEVGLLKSKCAVVLVPLKLKTSIYSVIVSCVNDVWSILRDFKIVDADIDTILKAVAPLFSYGAYSVSIQFDPSRDNILILL